MSSKNIIGKLMSYLLFGNFISTYDKVPLSKRTLGSLELSVSDQRTIRAPKLAEAKLYSVSGFK